MVASTDAAPNRSPARDRKGLMPTLSPRRKRDKFVRTAASQVERSCANCGRTLYFWPSRDNNSTRKYCNRACRFAWHDRFCDPATSEGQESLRRRLVSKYTVAPNGCWLWDACKDENGYGLVSIRGKRWMAHRAVWLVERGALPIGLVPDHLCRTPACVNPDHLEWVTVRENLLRGAHPLFVAHRENRCTKGHDLTPQNTYVDPKGYRQCRTCTRNRAR